MRVLITGGAGFIGSHLCDALLARGSEVLCLDNFNTFYVPSRKRHNIQSALRHKNFALHEQDLLDEKLLAQLFVRTKPTHVIHLAAAAGVRRSLKEPGFYFHNNVESTINVLKCAHQYGVKKVLVASSSTVYGHQTQNKPFREQDLPGPLTSPYAISKQSVEQLCALYHRLYGLSIACFRFFSVYGPRGRPDMAPFLFTERIVAQQPITIFGDGSVVRDFTYIDDIVRGLLASMEVDFGYEVFNLGCATPLTLMQFIEGLERALGTKASLTYEAAHPGDMPITSADVNKAQRWFGYRPKVSLQEGLTRWVQWYHEQHSPTQHLNAKD